MIIKWAPSDWKTYQVGDVLKRVRKPVIIEAKTIYREIGIRSHGKGIFHKNETTGAEIGNKRVFWIEPDCFVVNIVFAWERAVAQTSEAEQDMIASHRFPMYKPVKGLLDLDFITYFFKSEHGNRLLKLASPGGAGRNKTLGQQRFAKLEIPLPPIEEQRKIGSILGAWDEEITLTERLIEGKQKYKKGLMQQLLTGKMRVPGFEGEWRTVKLIDICTRMASGGTPSTQNDAFWKGSIPWVTGADFGELKIANVRRYITEEAVKNSSTKVGSKGDILLVTRTGLGKIAVAPFDIAISQDITVLIINDSVDNQFLLYYLFSTIPLLARYNQGTSINGITRKDLKKHTLLLPPIQEQQRIAAILKACDDEITLLKRKAAALRQQKKGLMQQFLTGKVRV